MERIAARTVATPVGPLTLEVGNGRLVRVRFGGPPAPPGQCEDPALDWAERWLFGYFRGESEEMPPLAPEGTAFQRAVWAEVRSIPPGATRSYGAIAAALDRPGASRAVGLANGRNPIPIFIPCHRVVGSNGRLTGYAGGLALKRTLLELENPVGPSLGLL